jgi:hypothetical protein
LESSDFRDSAEPTSQPMATSSSASSSTRPGKVEETKPPQQIPKEFSAPTFMEATTEQQKRILAAWKSLDDQKV